MRGNMHKYFFNVLNLFPIVRRESGAGTQIPQNKCRFINGLCVLILGFMGFVCPAWADVIDGWHVKLAEPLKYEQELKHVREVQIYTGDYIMQESYKQPQEGMKFILAHVLVEKKDMGAGAFNPNLFVVKAGGKSYERLDDDAFLVDFSMTALPHLNMRYGTYDAWLIYEVPESVQQAVLSYGRLDLRAPQN